MRDSPFSNFRPNWEAVDQPLYDRQYMPTWDVAGGLVSGLDRLTFFSTPIGANKTPAETNMDLPSCLPKGREFLVHKFRVTMDDATDVDKMYLFWNGYFEFIIGSKIYLRLPLLRLALEPYTLLESARILIVGEMNFAVELRWPTVVPITRGVRINVEIGGLTYRRVV